MYTYGPVPSRRLGKSLGVSIIPAKTCSYSCIYCQLGRTNQLLADRQSFFPRHQILSEIERMTNRAEYDYLTFAGDGEPTLSSDLGWLIRASKVIIDKPVAVITNGSLLYREDVRNDLFEADLVIPSLDAGSETVFKNINRPHGAIGYKDVIRGLIQFSAEYQGRLLLEIMLVKDVNDSETALNDINEIVNTVSPDEVSILVPIRPPAEPWVQKPPEDSVMLARKLFYESKTITGYEAGDFGKSSASGARQSILDICLRHPLRLEQAYRIEKQFQERGIVDELVKSGRAHLKTFSSIPYLIIR